VYDLVTATDDVSS